VDDWQYDIKKLSIQFNDVQLNTIGINFGALNVVDSGTNVYRIPAAVALCLNGWWWWVRIPAGVFNLIERYAGLGVYPVELDL
jgi:hypothetical protein